MPVPYVVLLAVFLLFDLLDCSQQYKTLHLEDSDLCSLIKSRKIKLGRGPKSALLVKQTRLNDHSFRWDKNLFCHFKLETSKNNHKEDGLFAVIQYIAFRKNESTGECVDYVQFRGHDGATSGKFCGRMNYALNMDHNFVGPFASSLISSNAFDDAKGELEVTIFVSKEPLHPDEEMDLTMLFTAYRHCYLTLATENEYKPCGINHPEKCIYYEFFNDDYANCPYPDCVDEGGCSEDKVETEQRQSVGNRVLIGSVSLLFVVFAVFVGCLWVCRKHKVFCWSEEFSHPSPQPQQPQSARVMEMSEQTSSVGQETRPPSNAPTVEEDKPPSYDSLFPSR